MTLKAKISLGLTFMFAIILALGGLGAYYLNQLSNDAQAILKDNYISLEYTSDMQKALMNLAVDPDAKAVFEQNLRLQERNVTEVGEQSLTDALRRDFNRVKAGARDSLTINRLRNSLLLLDDVNRQAMVRKNRTAEQTANDALVWLAFIGTLCFLVVFSFIINFPGYIANPLRELTRGIKQVASRNFEERLHFQSSDEFGELARSFNSMAQKLDEYEHSSLARVLFEKKRIDTLIQIMSDGIIGLDEKRRILFANPVACRLLGLTEAQLVGKYAPDVASVNDLMRTLIQELMTDEPMSREGRLLKIYDVDTDGKGKESYFNKQIHVVEVTRTGEEQAQQAGYVIVLKNITPYQERDLAKTNFIATVSHELKTPISGIKMSLKLLEDQRIGLLNDEQKQLLDHVRNDSDRLLNITGELLNMAQVESGQIQLQIANVAPGAIIDVAMNALRTQVEQKHIRFNVNMAPNLPPVQADPDKASWVLVNFLSNAVRHSPEDNRIDIQVRPVQGFVEFLVRDYGAGIRPEHRDRVFDRYFRAPGNNGQVSGTGLGLAISKEFITAMQGEIGLKPDVTDGAAFYFRLPAA
ncbi:PAS/PAC sensor signal transduction histidine kinase [Fibrisoma limi BUZ 3]|uniref:histidine kinase n=1 Tax=Fibrisoma limi BUZ 3 TaxID=1185876 RepID=I2GHW1_9BACT|nr:ATP-binding protein [Fibrisoma limi]CCH53486.1 PAS/PAC sensor signal transduction histidine kinase [Fibrisoma limi BUZ 3]